MVPLLLGRDEKHSGDSEAAQNFSTAASYEYPANGGTKERAEAADLWSLVNPENQEMWWAYLVGAGI